MALATTPMTHALGVVAASGTSVGPTNPVPDNCHTVLVTNPSSTIVGLVGIGVPGAALAVGVSAQRVPPGTTVTLAFGMIGVRGSMDQATVAGSGLRFDSIGGAVSLEVTYENRLGVTE